MVAAAVLLFGERDGLHGRLFGLGDYVSVFLPQDKTTLAIVIRGTRVGEYLLLSPLPPSPSPPATTPPSPAHLACVASPPPLLMVLDYGHA